MKARLPWFRMYAEFVDDPKVQRLPGDLFKFWMNCLGIAAQNDGTLPSVSDICWKMKISEKRTASSIALLYEYGLLDQEAQTFSPHNWASRQYKSDVSTDRVRRFRNGKETFHETGEKLDETGDETPPDTEAETETEAEVKPNLSPTGVGSLFELEPPEKRYGTAWFDASFSRWYFPYWNKTGKQAARKAYEKRIKMLVHDGGTHEGAEGFLCAQLQDYRKRFEFTESWSWRVNMHPASWLNGQRWDDECLAADARASPLLTKSAEAAMRIADNLRAMNSEVR